MALIGKRNRLRIIKDATPGYYLDGGEHGELLLPGRYIPHGIGPGDTLDVFIYFDSEDRLIATTETPYASVGDFASLKVIGVNRQIGAFLDWGLSKDLLLPFREQTSPVSVGEKVVVYIYLDPENQRIVATMRLTPYLSLLPPTYKKNQPVSMLIAGKTPLGFSAIVENAHSGLLYHSNLSSPLEIGAKMKGFVHTVREDGKIDLRLDESGYGRVGSLREQILHELRCNGGRLEFNDKSSPEAIRAKFATSKNAFKQALSALYKERRIQFTPTGVEFVKREPV